MLLTDTVPTMKGHWRFDVFEGDVERRPLTPEQERENAWAVDTQMRLHVANGRPAHEAIFLPVHAGEIVSRPIDTFEGYNLVTTVGKGLLVHLRIADRRRGAHRADPHRVDRTRRGAQRVQAVQQSRTGPRRPVGGGRSSRPIVRAPLVRRGVIAWPVSA